MANDPPPTTGQDELHLGFRFGVFFFKGGAELRGGAEVHPLDTRFQRVRGLSSSVKLTPLPEGGQNLYTQQLPSGIEQGRLVLERGMVVSSSLRDSVDKVFSLFQFAPVDVMITLYDAESHPVMSWQIFRAFPVKWSTSDLDATQKNIVIDTMELAYSRVQIQRK